MKFLCSNCKAKYQIADEKIAGRTLRMKCRKCGDDIVVRGGARSNPPPARQSHRPAPSRGGSSVGPRPEPQRRRGGSGPARLPTGGSSASRLPGGTARRPPSALGAEFRRQVASGPDVASRTTPLDQWHVAINDVPVGPIKRDEITRKITTGAVTGDSLCWREGFDDWRPLRDVPELAALLRQRRPIPPPPSAGLGRSSPGSRPKMPAAPRRAGPPAAPPRRSDSVRPAAHSNVVPIGGRMGAGAAPAYEAPPSPVDQGSSDFYVDEQPVVDGTERTSGAMPAFFDGAADGAFGAPHVADATTDGPRPRDRRGLPVGAWMAIVGAAVFSAVLAVVVGMRLVGTPEPEVAVAPTLAPEAPLEPELALPDAVDEAPPVEAPEEAPAEPTAAANGTKRVRTAAAAPTKNGRTLTAEEQAQLARMAGGGINVAAGVAAQGETRAPQGRGLDAQQLSGVVSRNRPQLQRCYENAIRGLGRPPTVRMDVEITVGMSGTVTAVRARGNDVGGLANCLEGSVRRWRFPSATNVSRTSFPVVFQPGS